ncbi:hypothetical protein [Bacillus sp. AK031]
MTLLIYVCLIFNVLFSLYAYYRFFKKRILLDNRYSMTITMSSAMVISLFLSMQISFLNSFAIEGIIAGTVLLGVFIGGAFGALVRMHAILSGVFSGVMGGMMGSMAGSVIKNPSLCGLPMDNQSALLFNMSIFTAFGTFILFVTLGLILYSLKV